LEEPLVKGFAQGSVFAASKFAVRGMTQSWQAELRKYNIRVTLVNQVKSQLHLLTDREKIATSAKNNLIS
jgi:3-oxoacyl-[acyl-carrier protein] reductase